MVTDFYEGVVLDMDAKAVRVNVTNLADRNLSDEMRIMSISEFPNDQRKHMQIGSVFYLAVKGTRKLCTLSRTTWTEEQVSKLSKNFARS